MVSKHMVVDVITEIVVLRPRIAVAEYAADPDRAPRWYVNIKSVEWKTPPRLRVGSQFAFVAEFRLAMRTAEGPFPMETTYTWGSVSESQTRMTLRNRGEPSGLGKLIAPIMANAMRRANRKERLKRMLETPHHE